MTKSPQPTDGDLVGSSHQYVISNKYYCANIPIWVDDLQDIDAWRKGYLSEEAAEVREEIACYIFVARVPSAQTEYDQIQTRINLIASVAATVYHDKLCLLVLTPNPVSSSFSVSLDEWQDVCLGCDFEYAFLNAAESEDMAMPPGMTYVRQTMDVIDWKAQREHAGGEEGHVSASFLVDEFEHAPSERESSRDLVDAVPIAYERLQETRESIRHLPEPERRRRAAAAVKEVMDLMDP